MSEYTDKLQEWVDSVRMCEAAGIEPCYRYGARQPVGIPSIDLNKEYLSTYQFPIAVVEGKPVFVGDELYCGAHKFTVGVKKLTHPAHTNFSWNPPKNTVMVELLVEDAEFYAKPDGYTNLATACRKALEEMK